MSDDRVSILAEQIEQEFLPYVRKPGRYIGGEINQIKKDLARCELTVALCFPDIYEVGMSHTGLAIIYECLNKMDSVAAERVFAPWIDAEKVLREKDIPLFSLESRASLRIFDIVGFSLTNELCYTNVLNMLDLGSIGIRSRDRSDDDPLIIAGGGMSNCCEPAADFVDMFLLGEGEEAIVELAEFFRGKKKAGATRKEILAAISEKFDWAYVPEFHTGRKLQNAVVQDFDNASVPLAPIVPFVQAVHERVSVEIMRGCPGRCRFCQASFCRRPIRYRSVERIIEVAKACYEATGFDTVSLLSLSTADYPHLEELVAGLHECFHDKHVGISLPSLRVDKQLKMLPKLLTPACAGASLPLRKQGIRKGGLTIAVEAASEHLRRIINKPLKDEDLFAAVEEAYRAGWQRLKLYFIVGLPGETLEDVERIVDLSYELGKLRKKVDGKTGQINITVSWFVPKPHTPLSWLGQRPKAYFEQAKRLIIDKKLKLRARFLQFKFHDIERSILESAIGRGDRKLGDVIEAAWQAGARFDLWDECFDHELWRKAFEQYGIDIETAAQRQFDPEDSLPWDHLGGPDKKYLLGHFEEAKKEIENSDCRT
ncbi:MAG: TIGR03960 family B12-binding radical SAM protein [Phycisphaerales bacterium]|nr:MAG: TIGR03960 family B12-binding radical SAM protein [Phycisphaerales bacterium]